LQPLKTGAARIALGAAFEDRVPRVVTVPVGLAYDSKARFRSRALVRVGVPESVAAWAQRYERDDHDAVRALTDDMAARLRLVSPDYRSWNEADRLGQIAEVFDRRFGDVPSEVDLGERERVARSLASADGDPGPGGPMGSLELAFERYQRDLTLLGLTDAQVAASYGRARLRLVLAWSIVKVVVAAPLAAVGAVVHVVPYQLMKRVGRLPANEGMRATVKLLGCFASFTLVYVAIGVVVGTRFGPWAGLAGAVAAPACGYVAVLFSERVKRLGGLVAGARAVRSKRAVLESVRANRMAVVDLTRSVLGS
jgi:hypothetical protein